MLSRRRVAYWLRGASQSRAVSFALVALLHSLKSASRTTMLAGSRKKEAAWEFIKWAMSKEMWTALGKDGFHRVKQGFGLEQHAFTATEWAVVHGLMPVRSPVTQIVDFGLNSARFDGAADDAVVQNAGKELREDRE